MGETAAAFARQLCVTRGGRPAGHKGSGLRQQIHIRALADGGSARVRIQVVYTIEAE